MFFKLLLYDVYDTDNKYSVALAGVAGPHINVNGRLNGTEWQWTSCDWVESPAAAAAESTIARCWSWSQANPANDAITIIASHGIRSRRQTVFTHNSGGANQLRTDVIQFSY